MYVLFLQDGTPVKISGDLICGENWCWRAIQTAIKTAFSQLGISCFSDRLVGLNKDGASVKMGIHTRLGALACFGLLLQSHRRGDLTCLVVNCRSIKNKIADITVVINEHKPDINNSEIFPENYKIYRKGRVFIDIYSQGDGVFQPVKNDLIITNWSEWDSDCKIIWSRCQLVGDRSAKSIYFGSYCWPNIANMKSIDKLNTSLLKMGSTLHKNNVILAGDWNKPRQPNYSIQKTPWSFWWPWFKSACRRTNKVTREYS